MSKHRENTENFVSSNCKCSDSKSKGYCDKAEYVCQVSSVYAILTNYVNWHRENLRSDRENTLIMTAPCPKIGELVHREIPIFRVFLIIKSFHSHSIEVCIFYVEKSSYHILINKQQLLGIFSINLKIQLEWVPCDIVFGKNEICTHTL